MAYAAGPLVCGLVVVAADWVRLLYGERWAETIPLIRVLAPMALPLLLARPVTAWLQASGHEAWPARIQLAALPLVAAGLWFGVPRGVLAVAAAMAVVLALESAATVAAALGAGAAPAGAWLRAVWSGLLPSVIMGAGLWPAAIATRGVEPLAARLALHILIAVTLFGAASLLFARSHLIELRDLTRHALKGRS
jgi:O-antigen/teichoic acid export membrane protein